MAEALVLETSQCKFESYRGYNGEITERGSGLLAKQSVLIITGWVSVTHFSAMEGSAQWCATRLEILGRQKCRGSIPMPSALRYSSIVRACALYAQGYRFKSYYLNENKNGKYFNGRWNALGAFGCWFDSSLPDRC